jgi:hypothetical protein
MDNHTGTLVVDERRFRRNLWILGLFSLPVTYLGILLAVLIHEVIGHGWTAALLGGRFNGFGILLDGMGWADVELAGLSDLRKALVFLGGAFYTTVFSLLFWTLSMAFKRNYFMRFTFLLWSVICLLDGVPYFFWDAIYLGGIGDFSMIWMLYHNPILRMLSIGLCGPWMAIAIVLFNIHYYEVAYSWLGEGKPIQLKGRVMLALVIFLLQSLGWFSLDWNQLIPGIGPLPNILALVIVLVTLVTQIAFSKIHSFKEPAQEIVPAKTPIIAAWIACAGAVFSILQWLQNGVPIP